MPEWTRDELDEWFGDDREAMSETMRHEREAARQCIDRRDGRCAGEEFPYTSRSGCTTSIRCDHHKAVHDRTMDEVERGLQERYPGYNVAGSPPPPGFDPAYAGESWDEPE